MGIGYSLDKTSRDAILIFAHSRRDSTWPRSALACRRSRCWTLRTRFPSRRSCTSAVPTSSGPAGGASPLTLSIAARLLRPGHNHSFRSSFSAGSTPIFASKYAFFSIFQALQENHLLASKFAKFCKNFTEFCKILRIFRNFQKKCKILKNFTKISRNFAKFLRIFLEIF